MIWRWASQSVQGTSHVQTNTPCQDSSECFVVARGDAEWLVAIASDGAGSARHADIGSRLACSVFGSLITKHIEAPQPLSMIDSNRIENWLQHFRDRIELEAIENNSSVRDYAATLLAVVISNDELFFLQLGDGAIVFRLDESDSPYALATWPDNGEYENQTFFLTDPVDVPRFRHEVVKGRIAQIAMITDGLQRLALDYATQTPHEPFFTPILAALTPEMAGCQDELSDALSAFLSSDNVNARTNDDKTLIIASRMPAESIETAMMDNHYDESSENATVR